MNEVICTTCPVGCIIRVFDESGELHVEGHRCDKGIDFAREEMTAPRRVLTTTIRIGDDPSKRLAVRTAAAIPRNLLFEAVTAIKAVELKPPVKCGQVILPNLLNTGIDVIASCDAL